MSAARTRKPSPLAGEGGARSAPGEGYPAWASLPLTRHLAALDATLSHKGRGKESRAMKSARRPLLNQAMNRLNRNRNLRGVPQDSETTRFFRSRAGSSSSKQRSGLNQHLNEPHDFISVITELDPAIHSAAPRVWRVSLDARVKPGHDMN